MCDCQKSKVDEILNDDVGKTLAELKKTANSLGMEVVELNDAIAGEVSDESELTDEGGDRRLTPQARMGSINEISRLKGLYDS